MRITSTDSASLALQVVRYEREAPDEDDWLVVAGEVRLADGRAWSFTNACLRVVEARLLGVWLVDDQPQPLDFVEPLLAFARTPDGVRLTLSHESLPPWVLGERPVGREARREWRDRLGYTYGVDLVVRGAGLVAAGEEWLRALEAYPERTPV